MNLHSFASKLFWRELFQPSRGVAQQLSSLTLPSIHSSLLVLSKKYLRAGDEAPRYAKRASTSKLDPYADKLSTWRLIEATRSRKQRRTLLQLHTSYRFKNSSADQVRKGENDTYQQRELLCSQKGVGQHLMEISVKDQWNSTHGTSTRRCSALNLARFSRLFAVRRIALGAISQNCSHARSTNEMLA